MKIMVLPLERTQHASLRISMRLLVFLIWLVPPSVVTAQPQVEDFLGFAVEMLQQQRLQQQWPQQQQKWSQQAPQARHQRLPGTADQFRLSNGRKWLIIASRETEQEARLYVEERGVFFPD